MNNEECGNEFKIFGNNVKKYRESKGLSIKELSDKTGITERYLTRIEQGIARRVNVSHIFILAEGLKIQPHKLCDGI